MRVKLGLKIYFCTFVEKGSRYILIKTTEGSYLIDTDDSVLAETCFNDLLTKGYCDFSECVYEEYNK